MNNKNNFNDNYSINNSKDDVILNVPLLLNQSHNNININYGSISSPQIQTTTSPILYYQQQQQQQQQLNQDQILNNNVIILKKNKTTYRFDDVYYNELSPFINQQQFLEVLDLINNLSDKALLYEHSSRSCYRYKLFDLIFLLCFICMLVFFLVVKLYKVAIVVSVLLVLIVFVSKIIYFFITRSKKIKISVEQGYENFFKMLSTQYNPLVFKGVFKKKEKFNGKFEYSQTSLIIEYPILPNYVYVYHNPNDNQQPQPQKLHQNHQPIISIDRN